MTVQKLIQILEKMPKKARITINNGYNKNIGDFYQLIDINPHLVKNIEMERDAFQGRGYPIAIDSCCLGTLVGNILE